MNLAAAGPFVAFPTVATVFRLRLIALRLDLRVPGPRTKDGGPSSPDKGG